MASVMVSLAVCISLLVSGFVTLLLPPAPPTSLWSFPLRFIVPSPSTFQLLRHHPVGPRKSCRRSKLNSLSATPTRESTTSRPGLERSTTRVCFWSLMRFLPCDPLDFAFRSAVLLQIMKLLLWNPFVVECSAEFDVTWLTCIQFWTDCEGERQTSWTEFTKH
jgi:hypothetical protein